MSFDELDYQERRRRTSAFGRDALPLRVGYGEVTVRLRLPGPGGEPVALLDSPRWICRSFSQSVAEHGAAASTTAPLEASRRLVDGDVLQFYWQARSGSASATPA